jgi:transketolase
VKIAHLFCIPTRYESSFMTIKVGINGFGRYGESAPVNVRFENVGFTAQNVVATVKAVLEKR